MRMSQSFFNEAIEKVLENKLQEVQKEAILQRMVLLKYRSV